MTPQERQLVTDLFDRLAQVENSPRDADAERAIADGVRRAPHSLYALVQTVLVQDEALKRADARIRELGGEEDAPSGGGFLDTMRNAITGRGSVPSVRAGGPDSRWNTGGASNAWQRNAQQAPQEQAAAPGTGGGSFLGTAAATAAGVIGGSLLFNSIGGLFGGGQNSGSAFGNTRDSGSSGSPWDNNASGGDLSRDAGANDVGGNRSSGLFDDGNSDAGSDYGGDFGGGDGGGGD
ncbi:MAG: DUF2076 domain-containing protein [Pseudolabrys sp.]|nr:DUF2076 domain-containing protein [Pseudolabrys sp.]